MKDLRINDVILSQEGRTVTADVSAGDEVARFLTAPQVVSRYSHSVERAPDGILVIPALANLCPLAWGVGIDIHVPELDRRFANALPEIRRGYAELYPSWDFRGEVVAENYIEPTSDAGDNCMLLFSGGVDSIASYIRHRDEDPILTTVYHSNDSLTRDVGKASWVQSFADHESAKTISIESNLRELFDDEALEAHFSDITPDGWWGNIQHGFAFLGLCAPAAAVNNVDELYIAASYTDEFTAGWGSDPKIDDRVEWSGTNVIHDGYELTRQQKIQLISDFIRTEYNDLPVRACWVSESGHNCGRCEKCCRTILGLELAGLDAGNHGFDVPPDLFDIIRSGLEVGGWRITADEEFMWEDLRQHADPHGEYHREGMNEFLEWFHDVDMTALKKQSKRLSRIQRRADAYLTYAPRPVDRFSRRVGKPVLLYLMRKL